jgi:hypothetical protein
LVGEGEEPVRHSVYEGLNSEREKKEEGARGSENEAEKREKPTFGTQIGQDSEAFVAGAGARAIVFELKEESLAHGGEGRVEAGGLGEKRDLKENDGECECNGLTIRLNDTLNSYSDPIHAI